MKNKIKDYGVNPFVTNLELVEINTDYTISNGSSTKFIKENYYVERQKKTNVYDIPEIEEILFEGIKSSGRDLLLYIIYNIQKDKDFINLKLDKVSSSIKLSKPTLINAISQLEEFNILQKRSQSEYWINPNYIFKGDRIQYYKSFYSEKIKTVSKIYLDKNNN